MFPSQPRYSGLAMLLHWLIALIALTMLIFGQSFEGAQGEERRFGLAAHSTLGTTLFVLLMIRMAWRWLNPPPPLPDTMPPMQKFAADAVHYALYGMLIALPLTGAFAAAAHEMPVTPYGAVDLRDALAFLGHGDFADRRAIHEALTKFMMALLVLHLGAVVLHTFVQRDGVLRRMLPTWLWR